MDQHASPQPDAETLVSEPVEFAPLPRTVYEHPSTITIRVYDVCTEYGAHTDPDLQRAGYAQHGI